MAITILSKPYGSTFKVSPVYNGLPFVVSSNKSKRINFRYICDIYDGTTKIASVKHNPDLRTYYGIFDIGKIYENTFPIENKHLTSYGTGLWNALPNLYRNYSVRLGEEYSRKAAFTSVFNASGNARLFSSEPHNLRVGDRVYVQVTQGTHQQYNGYKTVLSVTTSSFVINTPYVGPGDVGTFIEGEGFYDNYAWNDSAGNLQTGFIIPIARPTRIAVGDNVIINQDAGASNPGYDGTWIVQGISTVTLSGQQYTLIKTNCPFGVSTPAQGGFIGSLSNYKFTNLTTTATDASFAFNGVIQYREFPTWSQSTYVLDGSNKKFLTYSPKSLTIKTTEYQTLSLFANPGIAKYIDIDWFVNPNPISGTLSTVSGFARITAVGNYTTYFRPLDSVTLNGTQTTVSNVTFSAGSTVIVTTLGATVSGTGSINLISRKFRQTYPVGSYWSNQRRVDFQVGVPHQASNIATFPVQQLNYYTIRATGTLSTDYKSELFKYTIIDDCFQWDTFRFVWLNELGGWDYFNYVGRPIEETNINRLNYDRRLESLNGTKWNYAVGDRGTRTYGINANDTVTTTSGNLSYEQSVWLMSLYTSPEVYLMEGTQLIPINIVNEKIIHPGKAKPGIRNLEISFKYSFDKNIQRG